tara:strand:+ start:220 stop:966 length:747 start_codon:yes stop_codon:yes gene_type:complete
MGRAKEIIVKVIPSKIANEFVRKTHYSGKVVPNSTLHFGCFLDDKLHGVMSYGSPFVKKNVLPIVKDSEWNSMIELNRMAFDDYLPKYSESRCIAISMKLIKKNAPQIKWILSFSDGCSCGDGTIYRASGFKLIGIKENNGLFNYNGENIHGKVLWDRGISKSWCILDKELEEINSRENSVIKRINGKQLKYIYLIDKTCEITVPILPFSEIDKQGAGMYKGEKITLQERRANESGKVDSNANSKLDA